MRELTSAGDLATRYTLVLSYTGISGFLVLGWIALGAGAEGVAFELEVEAAPGQAKLAGGA